MELKRNGSKNHDAWNKLETKEVEKWPIDRGWNYSGIGDYWNIK